MARIEKRGKKYRVVWDTGTPDNRKRRIQSFDTFAEAKQFKARIELELSTGTYVVDLHNIYLLHLRAKLAQNSGGSANIAGYLSGVFAHYHIPWLANWAGQKKDSGLKTLSPYRNKSKRVTFPTRPQPGEPPLHLCTSTPTDSRR